MGQVIAGCERCTQEVGKGVLTRVGDKYRRQKEDKITLRMPRKVISNNTN